MRTLRHTGLLAAGFILASCGGGGHSPSTSGGSTNTRTRTDAVTRTDGAPHHRATGVPIGTTERVPVPGTPGTTLVVKVTRVIDPLTHSGAKVARGMVPVGVLIAARNAGPGGYDSSATSDFTLLSAAGAAMPIYVPTGVCQTYVQDFMNEVGPGASRTGCIGYAVPRSDPPTTVRFSPDGGTAGERRSWAVR